ncbi:LysR family transcriptional regulator [Novosphingobium colocasiae]|uniref:LysR family transcriptional regulator n=1 Tax=Novosphingobium colocasiae TaxID=1256513 RepID=UPI0035AEBC16
MNLRSLRYFLKVAESGSITRAALSLHITQPSLTQHLRHLEEHFGLPLFMRHGRGVILTEAGKALRLKADILIDQIDSLPSELESSQSRPRGTLSVGMPISWSELVTYPIIERFRREFPEVRIKLSINASEALAEAMNANELQLAVLVETDEQETFRSKPLVEDGLFLLGPAGSDISKLKSVTLKDVASYPMILPLNLTMVMRRIDRALVASGGNLNAVVETPSANILPLVGRGIGYTILSACALPRVGLDTAFEAIPITDASMTWGIASPKNRPKTAAVAMYERFLTEQVVDAVSSGRWQTARMRTQPQGGTGVEDGTEMTKLRL